MQSLTKNSNGFLTGDDLPFHLFDIHKSSGSNSGNEAQTIDFVEDFTLEDDSTGNKLKYFFRINQSKFSLGSFGAMIQKEFATLKGYDVDDFNFTSYIYGDDLSTSNTLNVNYTPIEPSSSVLINAFEMADVSGTQTLSFSPYPTVNISSISGGLGDSNEAFFLTQNFIDINTELFLNYYTEPATP
jgi:hypothetical protein